MPGCRYVEENGSAAMLAAKMSAGVTPVVNLRDCVTRMPLLSVNKAVHSGFETQEMSPEVQHRRYYHQKAKSTIGNIVQENLYCTVIFVQSY